MSALQIIAIVICLATTVAVALLTWTVNHFLATFRLGQPSTGATTRASARGPCCASSSGTLGWPACPSSRSRG